MIRSIEIIINNVIKTDIYLFDVEEKVCYFNKRKYEVTDELINNIKNTILYWNKEYGNSNIIDLEEFKVKVYADGNIDTYHGKGIYPNNYGYFKKLLGEIDKK